ncbi:MAG: Nif3-like dinuclear metal center hexameric protein [Puniceicoccales bacterium]|jgi:dinuclear metal center YbgI/SA1388 family protein|nr:Nif3-like dinuclear metal center hexameric protein [Puniceicoccales bacterium]
MVPLQDVVDFCDKLLSVNEFRDYDRAHNGLQIENSGTIWKIAAAVDGSIGSMEAAIGCGANLLIVHHGLFWDNHIALVGRNYRKFQVPLAHDLAVYAAHLPLDCHGEIGNNASLLRLLSLKKCGEVIEKRHDFPMPVGDGGGIGRKSFSAKVLEHFPKAISMEYGPDSIGRVLVCSGGGGSSIASLQMIDFDTVITGEAPQHFFNFAVENGLNAYICGHHATEVFGVKNLAAAAAEKFSLPWQFIDDSCPL